MGPKLEKYLIALLRNCYVGKISEFSFTVSLFLLATQIGPKIHLNL